MLVGTARLMLVVTAVLGIRCSFVEVAKDRKEEMCTRSPYLRPTISGGFPCRYFPLGGIFRVVTLVVLALFK